MRLIILVFAVAVGWGALAFSVGELAWGSHVPDWYLAPTLVGGFVVGWFVARSGYDRGWLR